jgi:hypothetical protein
MMHNLAYRADIYHHRSISFLEVWETMNVEPEKRTVHRDLVALHRHITKKGKRVSYSNEC